MFELDIDGVKFVQKQVENTSGQFMRVKHCSQTSVTEYRTYMDWRFGNKTIGANDPSCFKYPFANETYLRLSREQEDWWYERLVESAAGTMTQVQLDAAWRNLVNPKKAFTNNRDLNVWGYRINGTQLRLEPVICTGATVKITGSYTKQGVDYLKFATLDMASDAWRSVTLDQFWLIQPATSSWNTVNGEQINPFPKMAGDRMTPYILWTLGTSEASLPAAWFEPLPADLVKPAYPYWKTWSVADVGRFDERTIQ